MDSETKRKTRTELTLSDYRELLSTEAGRRVFGGIFYNCGLARPAYHGDNAITMAYRSGIRDAALGIANTIRAINPSLIGTCEIAYKEFERRFNDDDADDADNDDE